MKFYLETAPLFKAQRRAHIAKDENGSGGKCLCLSPLNLEKWVLVEDLPKGTHLCRRCERLVFQTIQKFTQLGD